MSEKKREENNTAPEDSDNPTRDEDEQPSLDMGADGASDLPPDSPITVGGDGSPL